MLEKDPFQSIDTTGVGSLVGFACEMGCEIAEEQEKAFKLGYVSCSPLRVPAAKVGGRWCFCVP
jgi:hypothetical protein